MSTKQVGDNNETIALEFLEQHKLELVTRNFKVNDGEIDLIMRHRDYWVFVEVKYRANNHFRDVKEILTTEQRARIRRTARLFLYQHQINEHDTRCRFDFVGVTGKPFEIEWLQDAF
ncbi:MULTISPECIES: YraN family protein [Gammaproteobacteria]|uniref:YraN family protein n=1 Tax=Gammaproteobacteria TaxID=1236 RepID=UPI000DCFBBA2|nr:MULTISPECIES: YraN family protein [Gammaproteobacteria]RTE86328.1 YraN family protein [Aliidiomarina sp. B3213]TCZ91678.1 YraN family protein [Lysobacter sp. N42]